MSAPVTVADILDRAADLIEPEGAWTQGALARGKSGMRVPVGSRAAICFCAAGALSRAGDQYWRAFEFLKKALGNRNVYNWNDAPERTQAEVVATIRKAAAKAREASS